ncbi:hypothetical protein AAC387_Pa04g2539 [Persea americana]
MNEKSDPKPQNKQHEPPKEHSEGKHTKHHGCPYAVSHNHLEQLMERSCSHQFGVSTGLVKRMEEKVGG